MAPRTARAKKNTEIKSVENEAQNEAPKKGRGKAKAIAEPDIESENNTENIIVPEKKAKRGKKAANDIVEQNGETEEDLAPVAKKGRKKNVEEEKVEPKLSENNSKEASPADEEEPETNGDAEVAVPSKGRKKQPKKEVKPKEAAKGKKNTKQETDSEKVEPKPKGRGRKQKPDAEEEKMDDGEDEVKPDPPAAKGRKKGKQENVDEDEKDDKEIDEEKSESEPKKKETKGRKNVSKKAQPKQESEDSEDIKEEMPVSKKKEKKETKKEEEGKGDGNQEEESEENLPEAKPAKGKRGLKKVVEKETESEDVQDTGVPVSKRRRKAEDKAPQDVKTAVKCLTDYESLDFSNTSKNAQGKEWNFKISTWNVDGIRAWLGKGGLEYIKHEKPDILCLQETKCSQDKLPSEITNLPGYHAYWLCSDKDGYAGVGVYTTKLAMNVQYGLQNEELDSEGRIITAEYELFYLICTYVPNAGRKLVTLPKRLKWNKEFRKHVQTLDKKKPVIICGDMNVAHNEIDLTNPKTNKKNAGFTEEERAGMTELLGDGFVDVFRHYYPDKTGAYTFWSYMFNSRSKNVGWRLDYFVVSQRLLPAICDTIIRDKVYGSDHCPVSLFLHLTSADKPKE